MRGPMLELRPNCEMCDKDLPPDAPDARICSYECTFCTTCVDDVLQNVCPNCGGGFVQRPIRPKGAHRTGTGLGHHPAGTKRRHLKWEMDDLRAHVAALKGIAPADR